VARTGSRRGDTLPGLQEPPHPCKKKAIWVTIDHVRANPKTLWCGNDVLGKFVPRDVKIDVLHGGIGEYRFQHGHVSLDWMDDPSHTTVRPDDGYIWMTLERPLIWAR
jgi:hypothetical protein